MRFVVAFTLLLFVAPLAAKPITEPQAKLQKAVLVTGASSGIGNHIATALAREGFFVYAGARKQVDLDTLSAQPNTLGVRLDVTKPEDIAAAVKTIREQGRGLYGLINNAGVFVFDPLIEANEADMRFVMDVNVWGPYRVTKAFAPLLIQSEGRITTTGSVAGVTSGALLGPYSMSKYAMEAYTDALAGEMAKFGVAVSIIEPGNFNSNVMKNMQRRLEQIREGERESLFADEIERFSSFTQADRSAHKDPIAVAEAAVHFMTAEQPKRRYMVVPNQAEANFTIRAVLRKVVQLNQGQPFAYSRQQLIELLDQLLTEG